MIKATEEVNLKKLDDKMKIFLKYLEKECQHELIITSGYRSKDHYLERYKESPGEHTTGLAVDVVAIGGEAVYTIVNNAMRLGCLRIGINRKKNFVHLGLDSTRVTSIWTY